MRLLSENLTDFFLETSIVGLQDEGKSTINSGREIVAIVETDEDVDDDLYFGVLCQKQISKKNKTTRETKERRRTAGRSFASSNSY
jgi:hypothetical protein